jgi:molybdenum cofactor cytidylyltransferase
VKIAALVLAAGKSSRMGFNKLLADVGGKPIILRVVENISASNVAQVFIVTGHQAEDVELALAQAGVNFVRNKDYANGIASSVKAGIDSVMDFDGVLICLGDMPLVSPSIVEQMIEAFRPDQGQNLVLAVHAGEIGNPVLWGAEYFSELLNLNGDRGARGLVEKYRTNAVEISVRDECVMLDADTPEALAKLKSIAGF